MTVGRNRVDLKNLMFFDPLIAKRWKEQTRKWLESEVVLLQERLK